MNSAISYPLPRVPIERVLVRMKNGLSVKQGRNLGGLPITRIETIATGEIDTDRTGQAGISIDDARDFVLEKGDILFSHINSRDHIGKCAIYEGHPESLVHGMNLLGFRPNLDNIDPRFLLYALRSSEFRSQLPRIIKPAVNQASVTISDLKHLEIPLPELSDQRRIVAILDKADAIHRKREQALNLADDFLRSAFMEMFGDPVTNPKGWPVKMLGDHIGHSNNGLARRRKTPRNVGSIVLRLQDIRKNSLKLDEPNRIELEDSEVKRFLLHPNDLLFIRVNGNKDYVGRCAIFSDHTEPVFHNDHIIRIQMADGYDPYFLTHVFNERFGKHLMAGKVKTSAGQYTISQDGIRSLTLIQPPIDKQENFKELTSKVNVQIELLNVACNESASLFASLSQRAFGGEL